MDNVTQKSISAQIRVELQKFLNRESAGEIYFRQAAVEYKRGLLAPHGSGTVAIEFGEGS